MLCDPQAEVVFRAESIFMSDLSGEKAIKTQDVARAWMDRACADPRISRKLISGTPPNLVIDPSRQRDCTRANTIRLGREASFWSLSHELAHFITPPACEPHGKAFCGNLLLVAQVAWGNAVARRLQAIFDHLDVLYPASARLVTTLPKAA